MLGIAVDVIIIIITIIIIIVVVSSNGSSSITSAAVIDQGRRHLYDHYHDLSNLPLVRHTLSLSLFSSPNHREGEKKEKKTYIESWMLIFMTVANRVREREERITSPSINRSIDR